MGGATGIAATGSTASSRPNNSSTVMPSAGQRKGGAQRRVGHAGLVKGAVPAVAPVIEVDAVFAVAAARSPSPSHTGSLRLGSRNGSHVENQKLEQAI